MKKFNLDFKLSIPESQMTSLLKKLEDSYLENEYHNSTHGADVCNSIMYLVTNSCVVEALTSVE